MRIVVALGGNALLRRGERPDAAVQLGHIRSVAAELAGIAESSDLVIVHGNGPQVGLLALESGRDEGLTAPYPLDDLVAETQGMIGYWLQQEIGNCAHRPVVAVVTRTRVAADDPGFLNPTKFIGSVYTREEADALAARHGWTVRRDGSSWRRVVPSPRPLEIVETEQIQALLDAGVTVVAAGGGGVPVTADGRGLHGIEAVVDKDLAAALLATRLRADLLVILTDVEAVYVDYGTPQQRALGTVTTAELRTNAFPAGSMGPKVQAAVEFAEATGGRAAIGSLDDARAVTEGTAGTQIGSARVPVND
jgi:carbamate kinase